MSTVSDTSRQFFQGDNLPFLRSLQSESIHLVATDPPFNKDRDFGSAFRDRWSWERDVRRDWWDDITARRPALRAVIDAARLTADDSMGAYLCWLGMRLLELRRLLRRDGSLYLHIDHTTHAYVKLLLDAIFGADNFRNEIVWFYKTGGISKRWFGRKHDSVLFYSKSDSYTFHPQREKSYLTHRYGFSNVDIEHDERGYFRRAAMRDVWDIPALRGNQAEAVGFPTQKPLALYERIIKASSNAGDIVLDPFCGSGTTVVAAEKLGRRWLAMDLWDGAYEMLLARLHAQRLSGPSSIQLHVAESLDS